ncbi:hypothetical protein B9G69_002440 [Bdellovibrio sp. SKB1291214]|uniref:hypothetical protein n=1 Tax=Bdellovibrio sp. SKB1291214 TaxID=1732569 RepID=UPI000B51B31D|nr:hypothetical protein [Bdellovibrio sp. SKB1291214]UYL09431.1 hypothetical protein B9G69_002440 [Bdellovibrio sp. SKB1291214]
MSQNGKYQLIIPVVLMLGAWWFHQSTKSTPIEKSSAFEQSSDTKLKSAIPLAATKSHQAVQNSAQQSVASSVVPKAAGSSKFSPRLERHVNYIALMLTRPDVAIPQQALATAHLNAEEIAQLGNAVIDTQADASTRQASLFILSKSGAKAIPALGMIAASKFKDSTAQTEVPLRITALESLDQMTANSGDVLKVMQNTIENQNNKTLVFLATISAGGIKEGRPGKLGRAMDQMIKEKSL